MHHVEEVKAGRDQSVSDADAIDALVNAVRIQSVSTDEAELAQYMVGLGEGWGGYGHVDEVGNAHVIFGEGTPVLMMLGHLDTVSGEGAAFTVSPDAIYGRGAVDAKGPLVAMLVAAANTRTQGTVHWVGAVEEETVFSRGAEWVRTNTNIPDAVIVGEPTGSSAVSVGYKGKVDIVVSVDESATHPASPGPKAGEAMVLGLASLAEKLPQSNHGKFFATASTIVSATLGASHSKARIGFRIPPETSAESVLVLLHEAFSGNADFTLEHSVPAVSVTRTSLVAKALGAAIAEATGRAPRYILKTGTCDMNTLARTWKIPMATYGPGDSTLDHADNEHILIEEFLRGLRVFELAARNCLISLEGKQ